MRVRIPTPRICPIVSTIGDVENERCTLDDFCFLEGTDSAILFGRDSMDAWVITESLYTLGRMTGKFGLPEQKHAPYVWKLPRATIQLPTTRNKFNVPISPSTQ